jgi:hypothetical protein
VSLRPRVWSSIFASVLACVSLRAQMTITGTITGSVLDPTGQAVANAKVSLTRPSTGDVRPAVANEVGVFTIIAVQPDTYTLRIEQPGFKAYTRSGVVVSANERVALGDIQLQVGEVTETISVAAEAAHVQTDSSEHSAELTTNQLTNLTARGRDVVSMLRTIPGVQSSPTRIRWAEATERARRISPARRRTRASWL